MHLAPGRYLGAATMLSQRLRERMGLLIAAISAVMIVAAGAGKWPLLTIGLAVSVVLVAALAPSPPAGETIASPGAASELPGPDHLSAAAFAAELDDPIIFFDRSGFVLHANRAAVDAFGAMRPGLSLLLRFRAPDMRAFIEQLIAGESPAPIDFHERLPVERLFRLSAAAIGQGKDLLVLVFRDNSEARRIDRMRADFIANASHELRTPLASVAGFIDTLRGAAKDDPKARDQFLEIMQSQTGRMARLIDDLLSLSRLEMKPRVDASSSVDVADIVQNVVDTLTPLAKENGVSIEIQSDEVQAVIAGDKDELFQVFENLVENACKYGRTGERVVIQIVEGKSGPQPEVDVTVTDFGPGIPAEHIPRITERFYRVDPGSSRAQKGTGLGLAIVKHILTRHGGRLTVKSEPGQGSSFTASLPRSNASPTAG